MWILPFLAAGARRFGQANTNTTLHTNTVNANKIKNQVEAPSFPSWLQVLEDLFPSLKIQCNIGENLGTRFCVHGKKWKPEFVPTKSTVGIRFCVNRIKCDISCWPDVTPPLTWELKSVSSSREGNVLLSESKWPGFQQSKNLSSNQWLINANSEKNEKGVACVSILVPVEQHLNTWKWS